MSIRGNEPISAAKRLSQAHRPLPRPEAAGDGAGDLRPGDNIQGLFREKRGFLPSYDELFFEL
jgi:hypothetical protein